MIDFSYVALEEISSDFQLTNRTVVRVAELTDRVAYSLSSYAPSIPPLRPRGIAGGGDYAEATDVIRLDVLGDTAAQATANYETLIDLIDQAGRWWAGEAVNPVRLAVQVRSSTVGTLYALLLGAPGEQPPVQASPEITYVDGCKVWIIRDVTLQVLRRGRWTGPYSLTSTSGNVATNPAVGTITLAAGPPRSPIQLSAAPATNVSAPPQWVALSGDVNGIQIFDMSTRTAAGFTTVADAANRPFQGTNILRYTPASTAYAGAQAITLATSDKPATYAVLAAVRTNGVQPFLLRPVVLDVAGRQTVIDVTPTTPQIVSLGTVTVGPAGATFVLQAAAVSTSGGPLLDISYVALVNLSAPNTTVYYQPIGTNGALTLLLARHYEFADLPKSIAGRAFAIGGYMIDEAQGDVDVTMGATTAYVAGFAQTGSRWTVENAAGAAKDGFNYSLARRTAYRTPQ